MDLWYIDLLIYTRTGQANIYRRFIVSSLVIVSSALLDPIELGLKTTVTVPGRAGGEGILTAIRGDRKLPWIRPGQSDLRPLNERSTVPVFVRVTCIPAVAPSSMSWLPKESGPPVTSIS